MAEVVLVCSACGGRLSPSDKFCPQCGEKVAAQSGKSSLALAPTPVPCEVCGHENNHAGSFCEACGVKLPDSSKSKPTISSTSQKAAPIQRTLFKLELWHYAALVLILAVVGAFVYVELQREIPEQSARSTLSSPPPASQTEHSREILEAISRLEKTVAENPNDIGSKLLLANALHDGAMHDASLLPRAIDAYKVYLKEKPNDPNARVDLGICYFELGKIDSLHSARFYTMAIDEMLAAVKGSPAHQAGAFNLGIVYLYSGNLQESNRWFKKATDLNPESDLGKRAKAIMEQHGQAG